MGWARRGRFTMFYCNDDLLQVKTGNKRHERTTFLFNMTAAIFHWANHINAFWNIYCARLAGSTYGTTYTSMFSFSVVGFDISFFDILLKWRQVCVEKKKEKSPLCSAPKDIQAFFHHISGLLQNLRQVRLPLRKEDHGEVPRQTFHVKVLGLHWTPTSHGKVEAISLVCNSCSVCHVIF